MAKFRVKLREVNILYVEVEADSLEDVQEQVEDGQYEVMGAEVDEIEFIRVLGEV